MAKKMEHQMESGLCRGVYGSRVGNKRIWEGSQSKVVPTVFGFRIRV